MTKPQLGILAIALVLIGTGLYHIANDEPALGAVFSGVGGTFAALSAVLGGAAKAKIQEDQSDAG